MWDEKTKAAGGGGAPEALARSRRRARRFRRFRHQMNFL
jgi:hypothetical protein